MKYFYILVTVILTVYGQIILKWQVNHYIAKNFNDGNIALIWNLLFNPWVISCFLAAFLAAMSWMLAVSRLPLSYAYPFTSLAFVLVIFSSHIIFNEPLTIAKLLGCLLIASGIIVVGLA